MSKHTPGPWIVPEDQWDDDSPEILKNYIRVGYGDSGLSDIAYVPATHAREGANARLIAAAPDLLEALQSSNRVLSSLPVTGDIVMAICANDAAIAKATQS